MSMKWLRYLIKSVFLLYFPVSKNVTYDLCGFFLFVFIIAILKINSYFDNIVYF